jgi:hypothetical protein
MSDFDRYFKKPDTKPAATPGAAPPDTSLLRDVMDKFQTFAGSGLNKASFGVADHAASLLSTPIFGGGNGADVEQIRARRQGLAKENPWTAGAGEFAGLAAQQLPVMKLAKVGTAAVPALAWAHRALTGGSVGAGITGQGMVGGATALANAATDNAWGEGAGKRDAGDVLKEFGLGLTGGAIGGGIGNALFGGAMAKAGPQIPQAIRDATRAATDPARMAPFGLTGAAAPNAEQALRMAGGEARDKFAPIVGDIFKRASKGADDASFPALRTNKAAQFPEKYAPDYKGSFAQRAEAAAANAKSAEKGIEKGVPQTNMPAASFLPPEIRDVAKMLRDAAINKQAANPVIPKAFESRFVREAANRAADPDAAARATSQLSNLNPTMQRVLERGVEDAQFKNMGELLRPGPKAGAAVTPRNRDINVHFQLPIVTEAWNAVKGPVTRGMESHAHSQVGKAGEQLANPATAMGALDAMGQRTFGQTAAGSAGYPTGEMAFANWLRKVGILPEATPIPR